MPPDTDKATTVSAECSDDVAGVPPGDLKAADTLTLEPTPPSPSPAGAGVKNTEESKSLMTPCALTNVNPGGAFMVMKKVSSGSATLSFRM